MEALLVLEELGRVDAAPPVLAPAARSRRAPWLRALRRDRTTVLAGLLMVLIVAGSLILPEVLPYRYDQQSLDRTFEGPSPQHWLGTDQYGRDVLTRLTQGGRISLAVGIVTVLAEVLLGGFVGAGIMNAPGAAGQGSRRRRLYSSSVIANCETMGTVAGGILR